MGGASVHFFIAACGEAGNTGPISVDFLPVLDAGKSHSGAGDLVAPVPDAAFERGFVPHSPACSVCAVAVSAERTRRYTGTCRPRARPVLAGRRAMNVSGSGQAHRMERHAIRRASLVLFWLFRGFPESFRQASLPFSWHGHGAGRRETHLCGSALRPMRPRWRCRQLIMGKGVRGFIWRNGAASKTRRVKQSVAKARHDSLS